MNILKKVAVSGLVLSVASMASAANSISGSTDFRVTLPEILVLYHWDDAHLILTEVATTPENDSDPREISDTKVHDLTAEVGGATYTINQNPVDTTSPTSLNGFNTPNKISVTLENSWAVRSLSSGDVHLALTNPHTDLINVEDANSKIITSDAVLVSGALNGATINIPSGWEPVKGNLKFNLDLSGADKSGEYNTRGEAGRATSGTATDDELDTFLLTLTGN